MTTTNENSERPLWAPWRIEYIRGPKSGDCFLCSNATEEPGPENLIITRGDRSYVLLNAYPYTAGHALVAPYEHVPDLSNLPVGTFQEMMELTLKTKRVIEQAIGPQGFNLGYNLGSAAGAGLEAHVHGHIVPRWYGDTNFMPAIGNTRVIPEAISRTASLLRATWMDLYS